MPMALAIVGRFRAWSRAINCSASAPRASRLGSEQARARSALGGDRLAVHDIRRSVATGMADIGIAPHIIEAILNHHSGHRAGPAGIYNRSNYPNEVRAALALWEDHLRTLVEGGERKVVPYMPQAAT